MLHCMHPPNPGTGNSPNTRTEAYNRVRMESALGADSLLYLFLPSLSLSSSFSSSSSSSSSSSFYLLYPFEAVSSSLRSQRQAHPLKEDDRLEDTQAPANGFVLLASIGIKRKPPSKLQFVFRRQRRRRGRVFVQPGKNKWTRLHKVTGDDAPRE